MSGLGLGDDVSGLGAMGESNEASLQYLMSVVDGDVGMFLA